MFAAHTRRFFTAATAATGRHTPAHLHRCLATNSNSYVGFIGLGNMGASMALNLKAAGHKMCVYDVNSDVLKKFEEGGATIAASPAEVAAVSRVVVTMLPSSPHVREVTLKGVFSTALANSLFIDASTIDPATSRDLASTAEVEKACMMVDAPVSGGVVAAANATLTFMVGGPHEGYTDAKPYLETMGKNVVHCGPAGNGQVVKICNNLLLAISMIGTSEAMALGVRLGMDPKVLAGVLATSTGRCWSVDTYNPVPGVQEGVPSSRDYKGGFASKLMRKDLGLAMDAANSVGQTTPLGAVAHQLYSLISQHGHADLDFSSVFRYISSKKD
eukprot:CAMPEP_0177684658 /NCGR_PEP_ID=MMETSP0447-20121125/32554_1 /TAXON_ID=0 /ORGANISM="Stygamoeba regulata, Strain BSH-02190019" /LENGTH=329 /DNA_ID=CAMNT_0019194531 /DNA_START=54 /DNA_END=1044 /DNA_ORIENTATION=-